jgi:hypothetical protein
MNTRIRLSVVAAFALASVSLSAGLYAQQGGAQKKMGFFVTSAGSGKGADLGGLAGADKLCQSLAQAAGAGKRTWHAYLSASASGGAKEVNARDRIGRGPWYNAKGVLIARNGDELHGDNNLTKQTALTEKGAVVNGRGDKPNMHDILTGSDAQGRAFPADMETTCGNWTKSGAGTAQVGHHDRQGLREDVAAKSWNHSHPSIGCSQEALRKTGGNGFFYCFAAK